MKPTARTKIGQRHHHLALASRVAAGLFLCVLAVAQVVVAEPPPQRQYVASTLLKIQYLNENGIVSNRLTELKTDFLAPSMLEKLIENIEIGEHADGSLKAMGAAEKEALIQSLKQGLSIELARSGKAHTTFRISLVHEDRRLAPKWLNYMVESYVQHMQQLMYDMMSESLKFFENQKSHYAGLVRQLEAQKLLYEAQHQAADPDGLYSPEQLLRVTQEKARLVKTKRDLAKATVARLETLRQDWIKQAGVPGDTIAELDVQLAQRQEEIDFDDQSLKMLEARMTRLNQNAKRVPVTQNDLQSLDKKLQAAQSQHTYWKKQNRDTKRALKEELSKRGVEYKIIEPAPTLAEPFDPYPTAPAVP